MNAVYNESAFLGSLYGYVRNYMLEYTSDVLHAGRVKTRFLIISDTYGKSFKAPDIPVDVVIHCGNLTDKSTLPELRNTLDQLEHLRAPLKLVIAGNHDQVLDTTSASHIPEVDEIFGLYKTITYLSEGRHKFQLQNGAKLTVYASPYIPGSEEAPFQFKRAGGHQYDIGVVNVVMTHGPPRGVLDSGLKNWDRFGCPDLFAAVNKSRPLLHCFGHIDHGWGAKFVKWLGARDTEKPDHHVNIDYKGSTTIENLKTLCPEQDTRSNSEHKEPPYWAKQDHRLTSNCLNDEYTITPGQHTLFVNAAVVQPSSKPWIVDIELPRAGSYINL